MARLRFPRNAGEFFYSRPRKSQDRAFWGAQLRTQMVRIPYFRGAHPVRKWCAPLFPRELVWGKKQAEARNFFCNCRFAWAGAGISYKVLMKNTDAREKIGVLAVFFCFVDAHNAIERHALFIRFFFKIINL